MILSGNVSFFINYNYETDEVNYYKLPNSPNKVIQIEEIYPDYLGFMSEDLNFYALKFSEAGKIILQNDQIFNRVQLKEL